MLPHVFPFFSSFLTIFSLLLSPSAAQNATNSTNCQPNLEWNPEEAPYNASAVYSIPGFYAPGTGTTPPANWTYNTAVSVSSNGNTNQSLWIDTPDNTNVGSVDLPYVGCVIAFVSLSHDAIVRGQADNGDCLKAMDRQCVDDVTESVKGIAASASGTDGDADGVCVSIRTMPVPDSCSKYTDKDFGAWSNRRFSPFLSTPEFAPKQANPNFSFSPPPQQPT
ncbi:MAG: hypothetical protein Q9202_006249 [Teloschistes flavicans]